MKKYIAASLAALAIVAFTAAQAHARGGHGGGHHEGGHRAAGGEHHGEHHAEHGGEHHGEHHAEAGHHYPEHHGHTRIPTHYAPHNRPFTPAWYNRHPGAWRHPYANGWGVASFGATAAWLGLAGANPVTYAYPVDNTTVYTADNANDQAQDPNSMPSAQASQLANSGAAEPGDSTEYLPLGVFSIAPKGQEEASALVQLAVSKEGVVRGVYYDLLSDQEKSVHGAVDKQTQRVAWRAGADGKVLFETSLGSLTQESGPLSVHFENGRSAEWELARYEGAQPEPDAANEG